jgi:hypothetical protein
LDAILAKNAMTRGKRCRPRAFPTDNADVPLLDPKIGCGLSAAIALNLVLDGLSLVERMQPGPFDSGDVNEHIAAAA